MVLMMVTTPLQLVHLDFTSFETTMNLNESSKVQNILVIVDHFTRYTRACDQGSKSTDCCKDPV